MVDILDLWLNGRFVGKPFATGLGTVLTART